MASENNSFSFGRYLQTFRLESGKSLEDISKETRIGIHHLTAIESEHLDRLPQEVFVKGFLRSYSKAVHADGNEAVRRYLACIGTSINDAKQEQESTGTGFRFWKRIIMLSGIFLSIIVISVSSISFICKPEYSDRTGRAEKIGSTVSVSKENRGAGNDAVGKPGIKNADQVKAVEGFSLEISAVKDTWMKVIIDGQNPREYLLNGGDLLQLNALKGYNLLVGDAGAIRLNVNGRALDIPRESGRAANIQIP